MSNHLLSNRDPNWWGWGSNSEVTLSNSAVQLLTDELDFELKERQEPASLETVELPEPRIQASVVGQLQSILGEGKVDQSRLTRVSHATGKSYLDLVRQRTGECATAPDAVLKPTSGGQIQAVLELCSKERVAVVPFGGGTSVVGGVTPQSDGFNGVVALDLGGLSSLISLDPVSHTAVFEAGIRGPEIEHVLNPHGFTLGHFPQSYEFASLGGYVASRSAGQASTGYGRIDDLVLGLHCVAPAGEINLPALPASAAGPDLKRMIIGSEGTLAVITEVTVKIHKTPGYRRYEAWAFPSFAAGAAAFRELKQSGIAPAIARLSDCKETAVSFAMADLDPLKRKLTDSYLKVRGCGEERCIAILGWEGSRDSVTAKRNSARQVVHRSGGAYLGTGPGEKWSKTRYTGPYLRDLLMDRGVMVETLETATTWSQLTDLYRAVSSALTKTLIGLKTPPYVMCHISHIYESGASLYFTVLAKQSESEPDPIEQWQTAKRAASEAILSAGGTVTHHHAVGSDHLPWLEQEIGSVGAGILRATKAYLDPAGILNPGKLIPPS